jgi:hypothetical protein
MANPFPTGTFYDYAGAIHVHSTLSDGTGTVPEIVRDARLAGLDFVILTDHEHLEARDLGYEGWYDDLLLLVGEEVTPRFRNHYLAFDIATPVPGRGNRYPQQFINAVASQGGLGFIAHPIGDGYFSRAMACPWLDWGVTGYTGIEIWSYMHDWACGIRWTNLALALARPDIAIAGPPPMALTRWDAAGRSRRVVGLGTLDVHAKRLPGVSYMKVLPYAFTFRTVRTHILIEEPLGHHDATQAARQVYHAIERGRCFMAHDGFADSTGFNFSLRSHGSVVAMMGDEVGFTSGLTLHTATPVLSRIVVVRDGIVVAETEGKQARYEVRTPGVYRVEARRHGRPWIFSNPIYIRDASNGW